MTNVKTLGIAGGGQLGRMLAEAAKNLGIRTVVLDPTPNSPASQIADEQIVGDYKDEAMIKTLASKCDAMTYEIESVNAEALRALSAEGFPVHPTPETLAIIKDKLLQKEYLTQKGIPVAPFCSVEEAPEKLGFPFVIKSRSGGFDGRGNALVTNESEIASARAKLGDVPLLAEGFVRFEKELAIVAARTEGGEIAIFPLVETIHKNHICHEVLVPAPVDAVIAEKAHALAQKVLSAFKGAGVFGIELFLSKGEVLVNEVAPRVHNSGHVTIESSATSQFEQHVRAVCGLPLGDSSMKVPAAVMVNILGERSGAAEQKGVEEALKIPGVSVHIYGKLETRPERKMGHLTAVGETLEEAREKANRARSLISI